ncbi:Sulfatase-modifying factor 2 precursor (C-alpha-formyglycine-generating enzyme 2) [Chondromyces apiculatus DSM 436]|uniref:Sulfatase-modifying factor 2 (C-alpha-formyglycine-generating enzyme 2) n=1 Tax=Chondromyces apiculatus DSM 436 TaxID=1192034 RepID=A0A017TH18_9BACT|nr:Sulfatase-modifying factor 2 precursor (C-alpha-formyglycine-generating enzyme 2) [Chondromyces apiculatus DSM 436]
MERARTRSIVVACGAGIALGAATLVAYEAARPSIVPARARAMNGDTSTQPPPDAPRTAVGPSSAAPSASSSTEQLPAPAPHRSPGPQDRFSSDPTQAAACPPDMTLVDGEFCPALPYRCARPGEEHGFGCAEYARGQRCLEPPDPRRFCIDRYEWPNRIGELPRVYVDWHEARALCAGAGKHLCRRSEWILACEGPKRLPYPWGFVRSPSPCNVDRASIPADASALLRDSTRDEELARLWQADPLGAHPDCISSFGAYDLSGNVDEWTDNLADDPATLHPSTLNGGYWGPVRNTCRLTTTSHGPDFRFYQVGFRCCADPLDGSRARAAAPPTTRIPKRQRMADPRSSP